MKQLEESRSCLGKACNYTLFNMIISFIKVLPIGNNGQIPLDLKHHLAQISSQNCRYLSELGQSIQI